MLKMKETHGRAEQNALSSSGPEQRPEKKRRMAMQIERVEIPPEADSLSIDGWDMGNDQQQAYVRAINRHLAETIDTDNDNKAAKTADAEGDGDRESKDGARENHGIIGCGTYYPWVTQTDQWREALQRAEAATGYRASWHWNTERGDPAEPGKALPREEGWYDKISEPYRQKYLKQIPYVPKSGRKSPERESWETEREQRFQETLKRHQEMFAELLGNK